ncbi:pilus assembly protein [Chromobacterium sp. IIBBL 290-4]|uniref:pilus assembly protein n=1 Tax=Chromobacterium sp. IIBBL 290-4 TaxID=2953890 RepID=UPI0020B82784|nr:PilC/PilY family type IV pilus protein [Chromobacterium sp. IIBBL 290-4]UTH74333.1 PilC/PilY family type IV pilus protein [Chromobacterium sp. IIBBL 290-4]
MKRHPLRLLFWLCLLWHSAGHAVAVSDNFTGASAQLNWLVFGGACMTAGSGSGSIPACGSKDPSGNTQVGGNSGSLPDPVGSGALRLTNDAGSQSGAIIYNSLFPSSSGLQATFTTYTYEGDSGGSARDGADGMSFFLLTAIPSAVGSFGGSLGYSCSNVNSPYNGIIGGYLGLGMDEYGNFPNGGSGNDNTSTGPGAVPQNISLRGAGSVAASALASQFGASFSSSMVQSVCKNGRYGTTSVMNYPFISIAGTSNGVYQLPSNQPMANEAATKRSQAVPLSYKLKITPANLLSLWYSYNNGAYVPVISNYDINNTSVSGPLPSQITFGFAGSTGGSRNIHEIACFQVQPSTQSASSSGLNSQQTSLIKTGTQQYVASYHSDDWWGELSSYALMGNSSTGQVTVATAATWDASCVLSGGNCTATGVNNMTAQTSRAILSWSGSQGIPFEWANLTAAQQTALSPDGNGSARLSYLRGSRSNEVNTLGVGLFRDRDSVLGDIVNSSPIWVGSPQNNYPASWTDKLYSSATIPENASGAQSYATYKSTNLTRANVIYSGGNDGMMHGFRSGANDSNGNYSTSATPNDGQEVIAYLPAAVMSNTIQYSTPTYGHQYYVDATPDADDLFFNNNWHTWLMGGLGAGGQALYLLDISNPANFSETNASSLVLNEITPASISCANKTNCGNDLGYTFGTPVIARFHNGQWGAVFGNGYSSANGHAVIYIMLVSSSGAQTFYELDTGSGASNDPSGGGNKNGIYYATAVDLDGDGITDYLYAGDLFGNVWRFDVTSNNPSSWSVSQYGTGAAAPLFTTQYTYCTNTQVSNGTCTRSLQPITSKLLASAIPTGNASPRVLLAFGTGQKIPFTTSSADIYASGTQSLYGVWDWDMSGWNTLAGQTEYYSQSAPSGGLALRPSNLTSQSVTASYSSTLSTVQGYRALSNNPVCWQGNTACTTNNSYGWALNLPGSREQVVYNPVNELGTFTVNTTIPPNNDPSSCTVASATGFSMSLNMKTGGATARSFYANDSGNFNGISGSVINGIAINMAGSPSVVGYQNNYFVIGSSINGGPISSPPQINPAAFDLHARLNWIELR